MVDHCDKHLNLKPCQQCIIDTLTSERDSLKLQLEGRTYSHSDEKVEAELVEARKEIERLTCVHERNMKGAKLAVDTARRGQEVAEAETTVYRNNYEAQISTVQDLQLRAEGLEASLISAGKDNEKLVEEIGEQDKKIATQGLNCGFYADALETAEAKNNDLLEYIVGDGHDCEYHTNPEKGACDWCEMTADYRAEQALQDTKE